MPGFLKGSLIVKLIISVFTLLSGAYKNSALKRFVDKCGICFKESLVYRLIRGYFCKKAYFEYSLTYRFIMWIVKVLDKPIGAIGGFFTRLFKGSELTAATDALVRSDISYRLKVGGIIGVFISVGYALGLLLKGAQAVDFTAPLVVVVVSALVLVASGCVNAIKESLICKLVKWFIA